MTRRLSPSGISSRAVTASWRKDARVSRPSEAGAVSCRTVGRSVPIEVSPLPDNSKAWSFRHASRPKRHALSSRVHSTFGTELSHPDGMRPPVLRPRIAPGVLLSGGSVVLFRGHCASRPEKRRIWCHRPNSHFAQCSWGRTARAFSGPASRTPRPRRPPCKSRNPVRTRIDRRTFPHGRPARHAPVRGAALPSHTRVRRPRRRHRGPLRGCEARSARLLGGPGAHPGLDHPMAERARVDTPACPVVRRRAS